MILAEDEVELLDEHDEIGLISALSASLRDTSGSSSSQSRPKSF